MVTFFTALIVLIVGFFTYGMIIEKVFGANAHLPTPCKVHPDGVDFVPMPTWRVFLIQLLNIAGLGPIFGALAGAAWGPKVYLWIVFGTIFGGAIHDFMSGMMSVRQDGASVAEITHKYLGTTVGNIMRVFAFTLLVFIGVVFSLGPAGLLNRLTENKLGVPLWLAIILVYYFFATFLPVDKLIGRLYPIFGICLIVMALGVAGGLMYGGYPLPELTDEWLNFAHPGGLPVWAMMFVTVACGAVSGFHATQSPIMARCLSNEKHGRFVFYGAMVSEGIIALIWAAAGCCFYGKGVDGISGLMAALKAGGAGNVVYDICSGLLGTVGFYLAMIGVIACPITSGDTALRAARLTLADWFKINQKPIKTRLLISAPLLVGVFLIGKVDYNIIWRYFSWSNQTLAAIVLWTGATYLYKHGFPPLACFMCAIPAGFMTAVSVTYFFMAPECLRMSTDVAYPVGLVAAALCMGKFIAASAKWKPDWLNDKVAKA